MTSPPSNPHQLLKAARKAGTARTYQQQSLKKVDHPPTMDHNMHDDFVRNPPKNVGGNEVPRSKLKWAVPGKTVIQNGMLGQEGLGRIKQSDVQSGLVEESSLHS